MPPWAFDPDCREVQGARDLPADALAVFEAWQADGYREGDPDLAVSPTDQAPALPAFDVVATPAEPVEVDGSTTDFFRCSVAPEPLAEDAWLVGNDVLLDHGDLVHHVLFYAVRPGHDDELQALEDHDSAPGIACYQEPGFWTLPLVTIGRWAPGFPTWLEDTDAEHAGLYLEAGSRFVIETHYNVDAGLGAGSVRDETGFGVWLQPGEARPDRALFSWSTRDVALTLPAGEADIREGSTSRLPVRAELVDSSPHMHLLGTHAESTLVRPDGTEECLTRVAYDFDWQWRYRYEEEARLDVSIDDVFELTCVYDNSEGSEEVGYGDRSQDEMCFDFFTFEAPLPETGQTGICAGYAECWQGCEPADPFCSVTCASRLGNACFACVNTAMKSPCVQDACPTEWEDLDSCRAAGCPDRMNTQWACEADTCAPEWQAWEACWQGVFEAGTCWQEQAECPGFQATEE